MGTGRERGASVCLSLDENARVGGHLGLGKWNDCHFFQSLREGPEQWNNNVNPDKRQENKARQRARSPLMVCCETARG